MIRPIFIPTLNIYITSGFFIPSTTSRCYCYGSRDWVQHVCAIIGVNQPEIKLIQGVEYDTSKFRTTFRLFSIYQRRRLLPADLDMLYSWSPSCFFNQTE